MIQITPLYAGLLALLFLWLSLNVVRGRFLHKVSVGDGDDMDLKKRMRVQANWAEYTPIALILLAFAELNGVADWAIHLGGASLTLGRFLHAYGFGRTPQIVLLRRIGMGLTLIPILIFAFVGIWIGVF